MNKYVETKLLARYRSAYAVARTITTLGRVVIYVGALISTAAGFLLAALLSRKGDDLTAVLLAIAAGIICFVLFLILGTLIGAIGQVLKANLDCAVNTSPLLQNEQRAAMMGLA